MTTQFSIYEHHLICMSIRTRIMWIEKNFMEDTFSTLAETYRQELEDLKQLLIKYESTI